MGEKSLFHASGPWQEEKKYSYFKNSMFPRDFHLNFKNIVDSLRDGKAFQTLLGSAFN